jgi:hypothetical protein
VEEETQNWWWNQMPDPRVLTTASGKIEFYNDDGDEIGSLEAEDTSGDSSTDEVRAIGLKITGGTYS